MNIKEFYKEYEAEIVAIGCITICMATAVVITRNTTLRNIKAKDLAKALNQDVMVWKDYGKRVSLEKAKALLEVNNNCRDTFAIVHLGGTVDAFQVVVCKK